MATSSRPKAVRHKSVGRMGPWQLLKLLGEGSLTRVYLARPLDRQDVAPAYAIKALRREWWRDPLAIERMRREATVGRRASHPNLIPVLSSQVTQPPYYLVTPRIEGHPLSDLIRDSQPLSLPQSLWIARQVSEALAALHQSTGMIHSDVKPANIMVSREGHATLLDLGFCQNEREAFNWAARPVMGTLEYIAPEKVTSACVADPRSDLYSVGVVLYEMLTGQPPFLASDPAEIVAMHRQEKPVCILRLRPETPKGVASLVHRLLAKDPLRRPDLASEVANELARLEVTCFAYR